MLVGHFVALVVMSVVFENLLLCTSEEIEFSLSIVGRFLQNVSCCF